MGVDLEQSSDWKLEWSLLKIALVEAPGATKKLFRSIMAFEKAAGVDFKESKENLTEDWRKRILIL